MAETIAIIRNIEKEYKRFVMTYTFWGNVQGECVISAKEAERLNPGDKFVIDAEQQAPYGVDVSMPRPIKVIK